MQKRTCIKHNPEAKGNCKKKEDCLECKPQFHWDTFPGPIRCEELIEAWIKAVRRKPFEKEVSWLPVASDPVCSLHFVDGLATDANPVPTLFLSYGSKEKLETNGLKVSTVIRLFSE